MPEKTPSLEDLSHEVGRLLHQRGWHIAVAESCTGGLICHLLTNIPGSSAYLRGGVVAYADSVKANVLGVPEELLASHGAVSAPVAKAMARGVRRLLSTEVGVGVTGIAGPTGGTPTKPVGTVYLALSTPQLERCEHRVWSTDRLGNKELSAREALHMVVRGLLPE